MGKRNVKLAFAASLAAMMMLSACSGNSGNGGNGNGNAASNGGNASSGNAANAGNAGGDANPLGKYDPPIDLSTFRCMNDAETYPPGDSIDKNVWYTAYQEELGINVTNKWTVSTTQCEEKTNLSIVSGDLPDFFPVDTKQLKNLVDAGMVEDMTEVFDKYASPLVKEAYAANNGVATTAATFDGKLMAIPGTTRGLNNVDMVWIREDWRKKLNLPEPKTMDDLLNIIKAFVDQDPDGDGKKDTIGLTMGKNFYDGYAGLAGFFNAFHAYPYTSASTSMWIQDKDGKLVYGGIQPEMKPALQALQDLYKAGAIDPQFVVYDGAKAAEAENQGKAGVHFGYFWNIGWPIDGMAKKNDPSIEWKPYPVPSVDGTPAMVQVPDPTAFWNFAVKKGTKHPEAIVKMMNLFFEHIFSDNAEPEKYHSGTVDGKSYGYFDYAAVQGEHPEKNQIAFRKVSEAMKSGDASGLNPEQKKYYDALKKYQEGDLTQWGGDRTWGPEGSFSVLENYKDNNLIKINEFLGAPTNTMATKGSILMDLESKMITKIILGDPVDSFDQYVQTWKQSGGDQITQEVNDWYAKNHQ
ncbi:extracellular solute-binding protein [Paenibacillus sp. MWE-103]|uniref:Extracellular solute-binding protein n=1 Tax=Paenibacillus artemisiicola TaxID=1172618 RepID=A0ABS3W3D2_9BACL|nr:extracellular solute-binding protein [Paenibacillus artemisiicola]MBO7742706.1 extracellular solute-binding protein [Paenibacillus artemisiicola]